MTYYSVPEAFLKYILKLDIKTILFLLFLTGIFGFFSCVTNTAGENVPFVWLTNSNKFILLPARYIEKPLDGYQQINASFGRQEYQMNTWVKADENGIEMILLNEMGANMGELSFRDDVVSFTSAVFPPSVKPEYIIADFQLCFYDAQALGKALEKSGLSFSETGNLRQVHKKKSLIIEITKNENSVKINNHLRGYNYTLEGDF